MSHHRPWTVLLIGGNSGAGKSTVAERIGREIGVSWISVDDVRLALLRATTADQLPWLHSLQDDAVWQLEPEALLKRLIQTSQIVSHAIEVVVANHVNIRRPAILEGDGLLPSTGARTTFAGLDVRGEVRAVYAIESDEEVLLANMLADTRGRLDPRPGHQIYQNARLSRLYGAWLRQEAAAHNLPVVNARPYDDLAARILGACL